MASKTSPDLEGEIDRLYQLPLDGFTQARNELAARLRGEGNSEGALRAQSLAKPSVSAWVVNQLHWRARREYDALMKSGQKLRAAQEATLKGRQADVRDAGRQRDAALSAALERALDLLQQAGHPATPAMRLRIATDLDALAAYGGEPPNAVAGRLVEDLEAPGFEVFSAIQARPGTRKREPEPRRKEGAAAEVVSFEAIANARHAVADAEHLLAERRTEAHRAETALDRVRAEAKVAQSDAARAKAAWEEAQQQADLAERRLPEREQELVRARKASQEAAEALERARAELSAVKRKK